MSKIETGNFEIRPEAFAPGHVIADACDLLTTQGARGRHRSGRAAARQAAGDHRRQARAEPDHAQPPVERDQVHRPRRQGHGRRRGRTPRPSRSRSRTAASASAPTICRASAIRSSRRARATIGVMTAPGLACRSSRDWSRCTAAISRSRAASARARASPSACRSIAATSTPRMSSPRSRNARSSNSRLVPPTNRHVSR